MDTENIVQNKNLVKSAMGAIKKTTVSSQQLERPPLTDIDGNSQKKPSGATIKRKSSSLHYRSKIPMTRICSTIKEKVQTITSSEETIPFNLEKVTIRNKDETYTFENEVFIDGKEHCLNFNVSPIEANLFTEKCTLIFENKFRLQRKPAVKSTLSHKKIKTNQYDNDKYTCDVYINEYMEDLIQYSLKNEWRIVLRKTALRKHNPIIEYRTGILNWFLKLQQSWNFSNITLFKSVYMFDYVLATIKIPKNMYQIVILTIVWIAHKYDLCNCYTLINKILALCNFAYSRKQLLHMEQKIFRIFNGNFSIEEPMLFVSYYLNKLNLENGLLICVVRYILECFTLHEEFSINPPSKLAAVAINLFLESLIPTVDWNILKDHNGFYPVDDIKRLRLKMLLQIREIRKPIYPYKEVLQKYATKENHYVSLLFFKN